MEMISVDMSELLRGGEDRNILSSVKWTEESYAGMIKMAQEGIACATSCATSCYEEDHKNAKCGGPKWAKSL